VVTQTWYQNLTLKKDDMVFMAVHQPALILELAGSKMSSTHLVISVAIATGMKIK